MTCEGCGKRLDVRAQQAFARAHAAFADAEEATADLRLREPRRPYRAKSRSDSLPLDPSLVRAYQQAYFGMRVALERPLPPVQQLSGVTMMAEITRRLAPRAMASPLEAEYWTRLAIELTAQDELAALEERLDAVAQRSIVQRALLSLPQRLRRRQLVAALAKLRRQTDELQRAIGFLEPPRIDRRAL
jgi:hypothetical protein